MEKAREAALSSTCLRRQVGSVLIASGRVLSTGSNKTPSPLPGCKELGACAQEQNNLQRGNLQFCRAMHSEVECILKANYILKYVDCDLIMYCTDSPCRYCAFIIIAAGIKK